MSISVREELGVVRSVNKASIISQFTAVPLWLWLLQLFSVSVFQMVFFVFMADYVDNPEITVGYVALGNAIQSVAFVTVFAICNVPGLEKHQGTLSLVMSTPTSMFTFFIGKALFQIFAGILAVTISLLFAVIVLGVGFASADLLSVALVIVLVSFAMTGFGLMIGSVGIYLRSSTILASIILYVGILFCGIDFPVAYLPDVLRPISYCLPLTYGADALREAASGGTVIDILPDLLAIVTIGVIMLAVAYALLRRFERMARKKGTLDMF